MNNNDLAAGLRETIVSLTHSCPKGLIVDDCPFRMLSGLCHGTKMDTLRQMDHAALLTLFDCSSSCRCPADPRLQSRDKGEQPPITPKATDLPQV